MALRGVFTSHSSGPTGLAQLAEVLEPLGGAVTPPSVEAWRSAVQPMPVRLIREAVEQLNASYVMLNTEEHARFARSPWQGQGQPFEFRRFLRVIDAVILAGPDAVRRVEDAPAALADYDTAAGLEPRAFYADEHPDESPLQPLLRARLDEIWPVEKRPRGPKSWWPPLPKFGPEVPESWPSLAGVANARAHLLSLDPSVPWLDFDARFDAPGHSGTAGSWVVSGRRAAERVFTALGDDVSTVADGVESVAVRFAAPGHDGGESHRDGPNAVYSVPLTVSEHALTDRQARIDVLTRRGAAALLTLPLSSRAREAATGLAEAVAVP